MAKKHRYTGEWPPPKVLKQFPNWEMAYEEDGLEDGQDDTTIRPQAEQAVITYDTIHSAGDVTLADGRSYPAIITVVSGPPDACSFHDGKRWWAIQTFRKKWQPQGDSVDMKDKSIFPLRIRTRLPKQDGKHWQIEVRSNGTQKEWK